MHCVSGSSPCCSLQIRLRFDAPTPPTPSFRTPHPPAPARSPHHPTMAGLCMIQSVPRLCERERAGGRWCAVLAGSCRHAWTCLVQDSQSIHRPQAGSIRVSTKTGQTLQSSRCLRGIIPCNNIGTNTCRVLHAEDGIVCGTTVSIVSRHASCSQQGPRQSDSLTKTLGHSERGLHERLLSIFPNDDVKRPD